MINWFTEAPSRMMYMHQYIQRRDMTIVARLP